MTRLIKQRSNRKLTRRGSHQVMMEVLEVRTLFSLIPINSGLFGDPFFTYQGDAGSTAPSSGAITYSFATDKLSITGAPVSLQMLGGTYTPSVGTPSNFQITISVNSSGHASSFANPNLDLTMSGSVTINGKSYSGTLLTGQIEQFGYEAGGGGGTGVDSFDFRFGVTGGQLAQNFTSGKDIGVTLATEKSNFKDFSQDFSATVVKGNLGSIPGGGSGRPLINTVAGGPVIIGSCAKLTDTATLSGANPATGFITFKLYGPGATPGVTTPLDTETVKVTANKSYSTPAGFVPTVVGTYLWTATYSDKNNNILAVDVGVDESETVSKANPNLYTCASISYGNTCGYTRSDTWFGCYGPLWNNFCDNWRSSYQGSCGNSYSSYCVGSSGSSGGGTSQNWCSGSSGGSWQNGCGDQSGGWSGNWSDNSNGSAIPQDSAVLSGTYKGTGSLFFTLTAPDGSVAAKQTITVKGDGIYKTSNTNVATESGVYTWSVVYKGDASNASVNDQGGSAEQVVVGNKGSISGTVFNDCNNDGIQQRSESGIGGATITLTGTTTYGGKSVNITTTTDCNGDYQFSNLFAGTYTVKEITPAGYSDGKDSAGSAGGTVPVVDNDIISNIPLGAGVAATDYNFGEHKNSSIGGCIFDDRNYGGGSSGSYRGICGIKVTLKGCDDQGRAICQTTYTDASGNYSFCGLRAGSYSVCQSRPNNYYNSRNTCGSSGGNAGFDQICNINLDWNRNTSGYNFGNRC